MAGWVFGTTSRRLSHFTNNIFAYLVFKMTLIFLLIIFQFLVKCVAKSLTRERENKIA